MLDKQKMRDYIFKASKHVKRIAYLIAAVGAATSYGTQVELLKEWGMEIWAAYAVPGTIDALAICAAIALAIPFLPEEIRKYATRILTIAVLVSVTANLMGGHNWVTRLGHVWPVVAYLFAEGLATRLNRFVAQIIAEAPAEVKIVPEPSAPQPAVHATATVSKPTAVPTAKPLSAKARILELAAVTPPISPDEIAAQVGTKPGWVKHVIKTSA